MGAPYGQDLRDRVLGAYDRGMKTKQISDTFGVGPAWARRTRQVRREQNRMTPLPMGGVRVVKIDLEQLRKLVQQQPDATIAELHQRLGINCGGSAVGMALIRLGLSFKKDDSCIRTGPTRCCRKTQPVENAATHTPGPASYLHRRNLGQNEHDPPAWPRSNRPATAGQSSTRTLENHDSDCCIVSEWYPLQRDGGWRD